MIEKGNKKLNLSRQSKLLGISRSSLYYIPVPISEEELYIKRIIDELYTEHPDLGYRRMKGASKDNYRLNLFI